MLFPPFFTFFFLRERGLVIPSTEQKRKNLSPTKSSELLLFAACCLLLAFSCSFLLLSLFLSLLSAPVWWLSKTYDLPNPQSFFLLLLAACFLFLPLAALSVFLFLSFFVAENFENL